jgi:hypothetical protein
VTRVSVSCRRRCAEQYMKKLDRMSAAEQRRAEQRRELRRREFEG